MSSHVNHITFDEKAAVVQWARRNAEWIRESTRNEVVARMNREINELRGRPLEASQVYRVLKGVKNLPMWRSGQDPEQRRRNLDKAREALREKRAKGEITYKRRNSPSGSSARSIPSSIDLEPLCKELQKLTEAVLTVGELILEAREKRSAGGGLGITRFSPPPKS